MLSKKRKQEIIDRMNRNIRSREGVKRLLEAIFPPNKPKRDNPTNKEDIINLKILLNTSRNLEEFLDRV